MSFSEALIQLKIGKNLRREAWTRGHQISLNSTGVIMLRMRSDRSPGRFFACRYMAYITDSDLLAKDWIVV